MVLDKQELETYEYQLSQVKLALAKDPTNAEYLSLKEELSSLIELTKEYLAASGGASAATTAASGSTSRADTPTHATSRPQASSSQPKPKPGSGTSTPNAAASFKAGDDCQARYSDGKFYPARITSIGGSEQNRVFSIVFHGYESTEIVSASEIKPLTDSKKRALVTEEDAEKERKRQKNLKKADNRAVKQQEQGERQKSWQAFGKKVSKKPGGSKIVPGLSGHSMFRSPDDGNPMARVGVVGSGRGMTEMAERKRQTFKDFEE